MAKACFDPTTDLVWLSLSAARDYAARALDCTPDEARRWIYVLLIKNVLAVRAVPHIDGGIEVFQGSIDKQLAALGLRPPSGRTPDGQRPVDSPCGAGRPEQYHWLGLKQIYELCECPAFRTRTAGLRWCAENVERVEPFDEGPSSPSLTTVREALRRYPELEITLHIPKGR
jgi:hypothetical protein